MRMERPLVCMLPNSATRPRPGRRWAVAPYGPGAGLDVRRAAGAMETSRSERDREEVATQWSLAPAEGAAHLVARSDVGEAVGCAVVHRASLHLELDDVLTHPAHERSGVGAAILRATAAMALDRGVAGITLLADPNSTRTTLGSNALWQLALLEMWLQHHDVG